MSNRITADGVTVLLGLIAVWVVLMLIHWLALACWQRAPRWSTWQVRARHGLVIVLLYLVLCVLLFVVPLLLTSPLRLPPGLGALLALLLTSAAIWVARTPIGSSRRRKRFGVTRR